MNEQSIVDTPLENRFDEDQDPTELESPKRLIDERGEDRVRELYRKMVLMRVFEERTYQVYLQRKIGGFCHIYSGQEAVALGAYETVDPTRDYSISAYREHGHALAAGLTPNEVMAELYGKATGCSRGKGGSMHLFDTELNFMGGHAIVGAHIPLAAGLGWEITYNEDDRVVLCFFGDGAMNQGSFHEAMNLIGLYQLPVVLICENNGYGMGTAVDRASAESDLYKRAASYDIPGYRVNGLNIFEVYDVVSDAVEEARDSHQPSFIEAMTYRFRGHSMSDPAEYRSDNELEEYKERDPIKQFETVLEDRGILSGEDMDEAHDDAQERVKEAISFAEESPEPEPEELYEDVYASYPRDLRDPQ